MSDMKIRLRADMIYGEINRMCVTDQQSELDWMCLCAFENLVKLRSMKRKQLFDEKKDAFNDDVPLNIKTSLEHYKQTLELIKGMNLEEEKDDD